LFVSCQCWRLESSPLQPREGAIHASFGRFQEVRADNVGIGQ